MKIEKVLPDGRVHCADCSKRAGEPVYLPASEFHKNKKLKTGVQPICRACSSARNRVRRQYERWTPLETDLNKLRQEVLFKRWQRPSGRKSDEKRQEQEPQNA